jgi:hypothetical protein
MCTGVAATVGELLVDGAADVVGAALVVGAAALVLAGLAPLEHAVKAIAAMARTAIKIWLRARKRGEGEIVTPTR